MALKSHYRGFDIDYTDGYFYIFRADLPEPAYMKIKSLTNANEKANIYKLESSMAKGDHYYAHNSKIYQINNDYNPQIHHVENLENNTGQGNDTLNEKCKGGLHYFAKGKDSGGRYMVNSDGKTYYKYDSFVSNVNQSKKKTLAPEYQKAICYFGGDEDAYILQDLGTQGIGIYKTSDLEASPGKDNFKLISDKVIEFLPGGIANLYGQCDSVWTALQSITNNDIDPINMTFKVTFEKGSKKNIEETFESHWEVDSKMKAKVGRGAVSVQTTLSTNNGGSNVKTTSQDWEDKVLKEVTINNVIIPEGVTWQVWQNEIKFGDDAWMGGDDIKVQESVPDVSAFPPTT